MSSHAHACNSPLSPECFSSSVTFPNIFNWFISEDRETGCTAVNICFLIALSMAVQHRERDWFFCNLLVPRTFSWEVPIVKG